MGYGCPLSRPATRNAQADPGPPVASVFPVGTFPTSREFAFRHPDRAACHRVRWAPIWPAVVADDWDSLASTRRFIRQGAAQRDGLSKKETPFAGPQHGVLIAGSAGGPESVRRLVFPEIDLGLRDRAIEVVVASAEGDCARTSRPTRSDINAFSPLEYF